jgi:hypothetical protein
MASFSDWAPHSNFVQSGNVSGRNVNAQYNLLAAGPPALATLGGAAGLAGNLTTAGGTGANQLVYPVGMIQQFGLSQNTALSRIFEIGSMRSYFITGRSVGQISLARVYYHGATFLRVLYAYYQDLLPGIGVVPMFDNQASNMPNAHDVVLPPGYENIFINLASDLFSQPIGLMYYIRDTNLQTLGAVYFENCYIPNHMLQTDAQNVMLQESVSVQYERIVPIAVSGYTLIRGFDAPDNTFNQNI